MGETNDAGRDAFPPGTRWLRITFGESTWTFELEPTEERAIVVGSLLRAHVRVNLPNVAPVHFHFEREGDAIRLICAYGADVRVNGTAVSGAMTLGPLASVEFAGTRLDAEILEEPPPTPASSMDRLREGEGNPALFGSPLVTQPTAAFPRTFRGTFPHAPSVDTAAFEPLCDAHVQPRSATSPAPTADTGLALHEAFDLLELRWMQQSSPQFEIPQTATGPCAGARHIGRGSGPDSPLSRLGILAVKRPRLVALGTAGGSVVLALALLAAARFFLSERSNDVDHRADGALPRVMVQASRVEPTEARPRESAVPKHLTRQQEPMALPDRPGETRRDED